MRMICMIGVPPLLGDFLLPFGSFKDNDIKEIYKKIVKIIFLLPFGSFICIVFAMVSIALCVSAFYSLLGVSSHIIERATGVG